MTDTPLRDMLGAENPEAAADSDPYDEDEFAPALAQRRISRLTVLLGVGVIAALAFTGGVLVQKHHDKSLTSSGITGPLASLGGDPGSFPAFAQGGPTGLDSSGSPGSTGQTTGPVVVGTVVSVTGDSLIVKDLGGTKHTVTVGADTTVTRASTAQQLHRGDTVSVNGSKNSRGDVSASSITAR